MVAFLRQFLEEPLVESLKYRDLVFYSNGFLYIRVASEYDSEKPKVDYDFFRYLMALAIAGNADVEIYDVVRRNGKLYLRLKLREASVNIKSFINHLVVKWEKWMKGEV